MSQQDRRNFEDWFGVNLERMIADTNAGFICAMVAFPLIERYLRRASKSEPGTRAFNDALLLFLGELRTAENADRFWGVYRHGLLHTVELNRRGDWLSHETQIIVLNGDRFLMNPALFARRVLDTVRANFDKFALEGLPQVADIPVAVAGFATTTYTGTGNHWP